MGSAKNTPEAGSDISQTPDHTQAAENAAETQPETQAEESADSTQKEGDSKSEPAVQEKPAKRQKKNSADKVAPNPPLAPEIEELVNSGEIGPYQELWHENGQALAWGHKWGKGAQDSRKPMLSTQHGKWVFY